MRYIGGILTVLLCAVGLFFIIAALAWAFSFKGVDSGQVCLVREGGPFDGRNVTEVRQPGEGPKAIGAWNHQDCLPVTERDLTDEVERIIVPSRDGVDMVVNGQALFKLTADEALVREFYLKYGRRTWDGESLTSDAGWSTFLKVRLIPILQDTLRQTIGDYECVQLKNTCVYVLNADQLAEDTSAAQEQARSVNNTQVLQDAQDAITTLLRQKLLDGLGGAYFEDVRFQNLKPDFTEEIAKRVGAAQGKRAEVAEARLEAQRKTEAAQGETAVAKETAEQIRVKARAYNDNPAQAEIDKILALCGTNPDGSSKGCANLQVLGGGNVISQLGR